MGKTALVMTGGGMRCSYSAGALLALEDVFDFKPPEIVIAASGSAGIASYYITGQTEHIRHVWEEVATSKRLMNPLRIHKMLDIDYLVDEVMKKDYPLDTSKIYDAGIDYLISATNTRTGKVEFFSNTSGLDIFEIIRATMAMPIAYGKKIRLNNETYCDTFNSSLGINFKIDEAMKHGAENILVVAPVDVNKNYNGKVGKADLIGFDILSRFNGKEFRKNYYSELDYDNTYHERKGINILILTPNPSIYIGDLENDKETIKNMISKGYRETAENTGLKIFLENIN
jgi:predicted patatin/cPLA2 family phospholipase